MFHIAESKGGARWDAADPMPPVLGDDPVMVEAMGKSSRKDQVGETMDADHRRLLPTKNPAGEACRRA